MAVLTFERASMTATASVIEILTDLSFTVEPADFIALVGPSGSGKTSLLRLMNRLTEASRGRILLDGQDIRQLPVVSLRRQVALVNQESRLLEMTVQSALGYPLRLQGQSAGQIERAIAHWSERLKIPSEWMGRTAGHLSLGQRQRVAIARALVGRPKILLLDEPTSAQDVGYSEFLLASLADWTSKGELTVIMANHQIELVSRHVSRLWHLHDGRLMADMPASEVDWLQLRSTLVEAEQRAQAEWE